MLHFLSSSLCFSNLIPDSLGNCAVKGLGETKAVKRNPTVNGIPDTASCSKEPLFMKLIGLMFYALSRAEIDTQAPVNRVTDY